MKKVAELIRMVQDQMKVDADARLPATSHIELIGKPKAFCSLSNLATSFSMGRLTYFDFLVWFQIVISDPIYKWFGFRLSEFLLLDLLGQYEPISTCLLPYNYNLPTQPEPDLLIMGLG